MRDLHLSLMIATLLGALGMCLLLPRGTARGRSLGAVLAAIALGLISSQMPGLGDWIANSVFAVLSVVTVVASACTISFRNPVYCAIWFGMTLIGVAGLFLLNGAQFLAVATIVVYAGAILVTFLFVLMLAQPEGKAVYDRLSWEALISASAGMVMVGILSMTICSVFCTPAAVDSPVFTTPRAENLAQGVLSPYHVASFGTELFGRHIIAIEVVGALLLAALVGAAVTVAKKKKIPADSLSQKSPRPLGATNVVVPQGEGFL